MNCFYQQDNIFDEINILEGFQNLKEDERTSIEKLFFSIKTKESDFVSGKPSKRYAENINYNTCKRRKIDHDVSFYSKLMVLSDNDVIRSLEINNLKTSKSRLQVTKN